MSQRVHRSLMNIKVGMLFYILSLILAFFSRKLFLDCLGADFIGLTETLNNILSFLNVAELGIGTSIAVFLYKPIQEDNHNKINDIMSMLSWLYHCIGFIIFGGGFIVSLFFPLIFSNQAISFFLIYFAFYAFLGSSVAGYLINYRQLLLNANQKEYVVSSLFQTIGIVQSIAQMILAYYYHNLYLWVITGLVFTVIGCVGLNYRINKEYPWLRIDPKRGRILLKDYPDILRKTRQIFIHRMKNFVLYRSDQILVFLFVSLKMVAYYGNYMIVINKLNLIVNILTSGMTAGVGNLIAEGNQRNTIKVFWELTAIRFLILGVVIYPLLMFMQPFIACWLGSEYLLSNIIVYLLIFHVFIMLSRGVVEIYITAMGLYADVWTAWTELSLNLGFIFALGPHFGIVGILIGKIISVFFIATFWKPYYLFTKGLHLPVSIYWQGMQPYYFIFALYLVLCLILKYNFIDVHTYTWTSLIGHGVFITIPLLVAYSFTMFVFTRGIKYFVARKPAIYRILSKVVKD